MTELLLDAAGRRGSPATVGIDNAEIIDTVHSRHAPWSPSAPETPRHPAGALSTRSMTPAPTHESASAAE
jgi:hypothetical protein